MAMRNYVAGGEKAVGNDLGSTSLAYAMEAGTTPSVVAYTKSGELLVGQRQRSETLPFSVDAVDETLDLHDYDYLEVKENSRVYSLACAFVGKYGKVSSMQFDPSVESYKLHDNPDKQKVEGPNLTTIGLGLFPFKWRDHDLYALHQTRGHPVVWRAA
jgi:hypothetical protein